MDIDESGIEQGFGKSPRRDTTPVSKRGADNADGHPNHDADPEGFGLSGYTSVVLNSLFVRVVRGYRRRPQPAHE